MTKLPNTPIIITRGDSYAKTIINATNGIVDNITGWTFWFTIKNSFGDPDSAAKYQQKVTSHVDPTNGKTLVSLPASESTQLLPKNYVYDIQRKDGSGNVLTILKGTFTVDGDSTRSTS